MCSRLPLLLLAAAALALPARAGEAAATPRGTITVTLAEGEATASTAGGAPRPIAAGDKLLEGDVVVTGATGRLEALLGTGTVIRLGASSRAELREAPPEGGKLRLKLLAGNFWAKVSKLLSGDRFEVETENGVAGVRGTEFRVETGAPGTHDLLRVYEGVVQCDHPTGKWSKLLEPGREFRFHRELKGVGPQAFDPASEAGHPFMKWVRARGLKAHAEKAAHPGKDKGGHDDDKDEKKLERKEKRAREKRTHQPK